MTYASIRGYETQRQDFYLLNKARKIAPIETLRARLTIEARLSERVPFGTGPALADIVAGLHRDQAVTYFSYHPKTFEALGSAIALSMGRESDLGFRCRHCKTSLLPGL